MPDRWEADVPGKPLRAGRQEVDYLIRRMKEELARNEGILPAEALKVYDEALRV
jgi:hypothetical protein